MSVHIFIFITFVVISDVINTSECVYLSPKVGYLYANQYPYAYNKFRLAKQENEVNDVATKTIEITKPAIEVDVTAKDVTDRIPSVCVDEIKQKVPETIKNDIRQYLRNRLEVVEPAESITTKEIVIEPVKTCDIEVPEVKILETDKIEKPNVKVQVNQAAVKKKIEGFKGRFRKTGTPGVTVLSTDEIVVPDTNLHLNRVAIKNKLKGCKGKLKTRKQDVSLKLFTSPTVKKITYKVPKIKTGFATNLKGVNCSCHMKPNIKKTYTKLKAKKPCIHVPSSIKTGYVNIKTSNKTQLYLNGVKAKVPAVKCKTGLKLKALQTKAGKINLKRSAPIIVSGEVLRRRISRPKKYPAFNYKYKTLKTNFKGYKKPACSIRKSLKGKKINIKPVAAKYSANYDVHIKPKKLSKSLKYKGISYKPPKVHKNLSCSGVKISGREDINLAYIKKKIPANRSAYIKTIGKAYLAESSCAKVPKVHIEFKS